MNSIRFAGLALLLWAPIRLTAASPATAGALRDAWKDPSLPISARVVDLLSRLTVEEKISFLSCDCPAIPRLGIPAYSHRNECLHGVARAGPATVFPQAIGMAATWDPELIRREGDVIATEARAKSNAYAAGHHGDRDWNHGLSFYSPNVNIFRDPRWGRGQETYGEDPFLTSRMAVAFIDGLQGNDPRYLKVAACAKHFAVHSGPEPLRHGFDAEPAERDLYDTFLPAFEAAVREAHVASIMTAHNELYGSPCCANAFLLTDLLRQRWGFDGFVVTDGGAIWHEWIHYHFAATPEEAAATALHAGCDLASGNVSPDRLTMRDPANWATQEVGWTHGGEDYEILQLSLRRGLVTEAEIDMAAGRELTARFRLGLFDPPERVPWSRLGLADNDTPEHRQLARSVAAESIVLLKNNGLLPLNRAHLRRIAVIGPNAAAPMMFGNYNGDTFHALTILEAIRVEAGPDITVVFAQGCPIALNGRGSDAPPPTLAEAALDAARSADVTIFVGGIDSTLEREQFDREDRQGFAGGDRSRIELPTVQEDMLKALQATGKPIVLVNCSGSAMAMTWEDATLPAILQAWYPGEEGCPAVVDILFGRTNPSGRLPVTFYRSTADLPPFLDYSMANRTYRYFEGMPLYAFGHGLSYTRFGYAGPSLNAASFRPGDTISLAFTLRNTGQREGSEVTQVYFRRADCPGSPNLTLCGFRREELPAGRTARVRVEIPLERLRAWDTVLKEYHVPAGRYELLVGSASDDIRLTARFEVRSP